MGTIPPTKEQGPELKFAKLAPEVWKALGELKRTGWVRRGVVNPETVQEHTIALRNIASSIEGLSEKEKDGLLDMLEVHDWPEAIHGDEVILSTDENELKARKAVKFEKEQMALASICRGLGENGKEIMNLWLRFETSSDEAASFAKQLDKYQPIEKALEYEKSQGIPLFKEFLDYSRKIITHPLLLKRIENLEREFENYVRQNNINKTSMKTILVDAVDCFVSPEGKIYKEMYDLLETYPNKKIILTGANDEQFKKFGLDKMPYEVFTLKHDPEKTYPKYYELLLERFGLNKDEVIYFEHNPKATESAESVGIVSYFYDNDKQDLRSLKQFLDSHLAFR